MKNLKNKGFGGVVWALFLAVELAVAADVLAAWLGRPLSPLPLGVGALAAFLALILLPASRRHLREDVLGLLVLAAVLVLAASGFRSFYAGSARYPAVDSGKTSLYGERRTLVAVPQPGDELGLAGGVMEALSRYGSEVYLLFTEAGEDTRALEAAACLGIPAEHVLFAREDEPAQALWSALEQLRPSLVLAAESAEQSGVLTGIAARLERESPEDAPLILSGLSSSAQSGADAAFYQENLPGTQRPSGKAVRLPGAWDDRLRLPVGEEALSRSLPGCSTYAQLNCYGLGHEEAERLLRGDRVFWPVGNFDMAESGLDFVKLTDAEGNFLYNYYLDPRGRVTLSLYTSGKADQPYSVSIEGERCTAKIGQNRTVDVLCPKGRSCIVTVTSADGAYWDTVVISNPGRFDRSTGPSIERLLLHLREDVWPRTNTFRCGTLIGRFLRETL